MSGSGWWHTRYLIESRLAICSTFASVASIVSGDPGSRRTLSSPFSMK
jgi:hypothetical protein